ncbi:hypothetical protein [Enhygromyxa salina]|uniref:hypothetical protein n=1 Tax=Enhygromyxa salina TaxID=215803 RepID=UPI00129372AA|nr:hypothetical protein [Enhygromyxa salina]
MNCQPKCGPDENLAAIQCTEGGGTWSPLALCAPPPLEGTAGDDGTGDGTGN